MTIDTLSDTVVCARCRKTVFIAATEVERIRNLERRVCAGKLAKNCKSPSNPVKPETKK